MNVSQENRVMKAVEWVEVQMAKEVARNAKRKAMNKFNVKKKDKTPIQIKQANKKKSDKEAKQAAKDADRKAVIESEAKEKSDAALAEKKAEKADLAEENQKKIDALEG